MMFSRRPNRLSWSRLVIPCAVLAAASTSAAASLADFGRCLTREGAVFYGTSWCPYCKAQRHALGAAMTHVRYVECSVGGGRDETAAACTSAGVGSYPTWVFGDGSRASGAQSLASLAAKTGCPLPEGSTRSAKPSSGAAKGANPGPKIIEIPQ